MELSVKISLWIKLHLPGNLSHSRCLMNDQVWSCNFHPQPRTSADSCIRAYQQWTRAKARDHSLCQCAQSVRQNPNQKRPPHPQRPPKVSGTTWTWSYEPSDTSKAKKCLRPTTRTATSSTWHATSTSIHHRQCSRGISCCSRGCSPTTVTMAADRIQHLCNTRQLPSCNMQMVVPS